MNLPDIMYWLEPPEDWTTAKLEGEVPPYMVDVNGNLIMERWPENDADPRPIRYLPVLVRMKILTIILCSADGRSSPA